MSRRLTRCSSDRAIPAAALAGSDSGKNDDEGERAKEETRMSGWLYPDNHRPADVPDYAVGIGDHRESP